jgi:hypothetical protein
VVGRQVRARDTVCVLVHLSAPCVRQYHSWAQRGAGEQAMSTLLAPGARARVPLEPRLTVQSVQGAPLTIIYGEPRLDWWVQSTRPLLLPAPPPLLYPGARSLLFRPAILMEARACP